MTAPRDAAARLLALAVGAALAVAALYVVAVRTAAGQRYDDRALIGAMTTEGAAVQQFESAVRAAALPALVVGAIVLGLLALRRGGLPLALAVATVLLGANLTSQVMKEVLERPFLDWGPLPEPSFPSGHAMVPLSLACAALLVLRPVDRAFAASLAIPAAIAAGVGVVAFAWHRPSDSIASALVAGAWTAAAAAALAYRGRAAVAPSEGGWTRARSAAATAAVALAAIAGIWFAFEMLTAPVYDGIRFGPYNLVGAILIGLTTAAMLGALAYLMRDLDFGAPAQPSRAPAGGRPRSAAGRAGVTIRARG